MTDPAANDVELCARLRGVWLDVLDATAPLNRAKAANAIADARDAVERLAGRVAELERMIGGFVRRYGDLQDGNGNEPTEIRRAKRYLRQARAVLGDGD